MKKKRVRHRPSDISTLVALVQRRFEKSIKGTNLEPEVAVFATLMALGWREGQVAEKWQLEQAARFLMAAIECWDK